MNFIINNLPDILKLNSLYDLEIYEDGAVGFNPDNSIFFNLPYFCIDNYIHANLNQVNHLISIYSKYKNIDFLFLNLDLNYSIDVKSWSKLEIHQIIEFWKNKNYILKDNILHFYNTESTYEELIDKVCNISYTDLKLYFPKQLFFNPGCLSTEFSNKYNLDETYVIYENNTFISTNSLDICYFISCNDDQAYFLTTLLEHYDNLNIFFSQLTLDNKCAINVSDWTVEEIEDIKSYFYFFKKVINDVLFIGSSEESIKDLKYEPFSITYKDLKTFLDLNDKLIL